MHGHQTSTFRAIIRALAVLCFLLLSGGTVWALTFTECSTCHGGAVAQAHHEPTDPNFFSPIICQECHLSISSSSECTTCHTPTGFANSHHIPTSSQASVNCDGCHDNSVDRKDCSSCHDGILPTPAPADAPPATRAFHHVLQSSFNAACTVCHREDTLTGSCLECHGGSGPKPANRQTHHTFAETNGNSCSDCHTSIAAIPNCQGCHAHPMGSTQERHHTYAKDNHKPCSDCHTGSTAFSSNCAVCHYSGGANVPDHHTLGSYTTKTCADCHGTTAIDISDCRFCHYYNPEVNDKHHSDYFYIAANYALVGCGGCHIDTANPWAGLREGGCISCHEKKLNQSGTLDRHHKKYPAVKGMCDACHQQGTVAGQTCNQCHGVLSFAPEATSAAHHTSADYLNGNCTRCHGTVGPITDPACDSCHRGKEDVESRHHNQTMPGMLQECATCHWKADGSSLEQDCNGCHFDPGTLSVTRHHGTPKYVNNLCDTCHKNNSPALIMCDECHQNLTPPTVSRHHNPNGTPQAKPCAACHSTITLKVNPWEESTCANVNCHFTSIANFHHDDPLASVSYNCGACHQSESAPDACSNCHSSSPHHATTWSQDGDCAHCHAVPAWAADRPAQAACRECHGERMHNNGGPIQNYGACAACHNQLPYHPAPTSIPGYTGYGAGKGKFNIFWSKYAIEQGPGERLRPNGEDMRDEGGYKIKAQQLTFSTKQISSNGKTYTVPYFTGMASNNLALNKTANTSRSESGYGASLAVDGNTATRWWARSTSSQWLMVDLGTTKTISKVALRWHSYYATRYQIQVSTDNSNWTTVFGNYDGAGGMETRTFGARSARYIRVYCQSASSSNGYSIYELEAYAP